MNLFSRRSLLLFALLALAFVLAGCLGGRKEPEPQTYSVSGVVVDSDDNPIQGVTLHFGSGVTVVTTDTNGQWTRTGLSGPVSVTPAHEDYTFDPSSRNVTKDASNINFTGTPKTVPHEPLAVTIQVDADLTKGVAPGQQVTLTAHVTGTYAPEAAISWSTNQGEVSPDRGETTITWTAPAPVGTWNVQTYVSKNGEFADHRVNIPVVHTMVCDSGDITRGDNPCAISTLEQLQAIRHHLSGHFILRTDIDASASVHLNDGHGFDPIGRSGLSGQIPFSGTLNGNNKTVSDLYIRLQGPSSCVGLFGAAGETTQIKNITLVNVDASARLCVGALVGENRGLIENATTTSVNIEGTSSSMAGGLAGRNFGTIKKASASGVVESRNGAGGLVGINRADGVIEDSTFRFESGDRVSGTDSVGGLVGSNYGEIVRSRVLLRAGHGVTGTNDVGGLVGRAGSFFGERGPRRVAQSFVYGAGDIEGVENVGGLIGAIHDATIESSYAFVNNVEGSEHVGGLIGNAERSDIITESYVITNNINALNDTPGGFIGTRFSWVEVQRSYWASRQQNATGTRGSEKKTTTEMTQQSTFVGWSPTLWQFPTTGDPFPDLRTNPRD